MTIVIKTYYIYIYAFVVMYNLSRFPALLLEMYLPCVFLITSHSGFDRTIKNNYFSWLLPLNRGAAFAE